MMKLYKHTTEIMDQTEPKPKSKHSLKILSQKDFESNISKILLDLAPISMLEAIIYYAEKNEMEIETVASLVTAKMKVRLEKDAIQDRTVISNSSRLPIEGK